MWWIIIWFLIGIVTSILYVYYVIKDKLAISLKDLFAITGWILCGPMIWIVIGATNLFDYIDSHINDDIIKFK